jgi:SAM-dependent methyltransferase
MKRDWADGYVSDVTYSHGYYHELAPSFIRFFLLVNGHACPSDGQGYAYCELGYGQGLSANIHAASSARGEFWGTDFNPDHALFANSLGREAGAQAQWLGLGFEQFLELDTPKFDFIVLHGVWSWISASAQHAVVEFLRRKLKVGGAVFISYNIQPGWASERPLRDLLWLHTEHAGAPDAPTASRIEGALRFVEQLRGQGAAYFSENARASQLLDEMLREDRHQLAHEYFNRSWWTTYFAEVARALEPAGLDFALSLHLSDLAGEVRQRTAGAGLDANVGTAVRETAHDFILNRRFRRDLFLKGSLHMTASERRERLHEVAFALLRPKESISSFVTTPYGKVVLDEAITSPLLDVLDAASGPLTLAQLHSQESLRGVEFDNLVQTLATMVARRDICPVFADDLASSQPARALAMNRVIADRARHGNALRYLASPVAGGGVETNRFERLLWLAWQQGCRTPADLCDAAWEKYAGGAAADIRQNDPSGHQEFFRWAERFVAVNVPLWRRLRLLGDSGKASPVPRKSR